MWMLSQMKQLRKVVTFLPLVGSRSLRFLMSLWISRLKNQVPSITGSVKNLEVVNASTRKTR